jgi:apolipoprotein N-acyltransferase
MSLCSIAALRRSAVLRPICSVFWGVAIAYLAWSSLGSLLFLLFVPILWSYQPSRGRSFAFMLGYYLACARDVPVVVSRFFPSLNIGFGVGIWVVHATLLASVWYLVWPRREASHRAVFFRFVIALVLLAMPPIGIIGWLSPMLVAGQLFPGWGYGGAGLAMVVLAFMAVAARLKVDSRVVAGVFAGFIALSSCANLLYQPPAVPAGWTAINTRYGEFPDNPTSGYERHQALIADVKRRLDAGDKFIVLPEEVAGKWRPATEFWWNEIAASAKTSGAIVLIGVDLFDGPQFRDSLLVLGATEGHIASRQPIPIGLWRPWAKESAIADWTQSGVRQLRGRQVAFSFCYEDLLVWPMMTSMWHRPSVIISVANNWFGEGLSEPDIQKQSIESMARLFGVPLVRAVNR